MKLEGIAVATIFSGAFAYTQSSVPSGFHVRRPRGKFRHPGRFADHGKFNEAEPGRKRHPHLGRQRRQWRPGQRQDARQQSGCEAAQ
jgi:hypothetical protein